MLAVSVGVFAALCAIVFRELISAAQYLFFDLGAVIGSSGPSGLVGDVVHGLHFLLAPALGLVLVVWLVGRFAPEAKGHGVPEVQHAVRSGGGRMRPRVVLVKAVASAVTIGSGGSVGREGPIVQVGSAVGSTIGQLLGLGKEELRLLVASGAAAGIGATFNAPIAGVVFALEVILGSFAARSFGLVVISSVSATALSGAVLGREPAFRLAEAFTLVSEAELPLYAILGVGLGLAAVLYVRVLHTTESLFERWSIGATGKAAVGGLLVGSMAFFGSSLLFGVGYEGIDMALAGQLTLSVLAMLAVLKIVATAVTLGAGGSGGVFAPALFIGAMFGGAYGEVVNLLMPSLTAPSGAYALVGMAGLFGSAAHAPMTAVLILFEMTDNYQIILPLMLTVGLSYLIASRVHAESVYSVKLRRLEGPKQADREGSVLDLLLVEDALVENVETVRPDMSVGSLASFARSRRLRSWPVVDADDELVGIVTETDVEWGLVQGVGEVATVVDIMTKNVVTLRPSDSLRTAFRVFGDRDVQLIPVVSEDEGPHLVGALRRHEMIWAFKTISEEHDRLLGSMAPAGTLADAGTVQLEAVAYRHGSALTGKRIRDLDLPEGTLITLIRRASGPLVPRGDTRVEPGDVLVVLGARGDEHLIREWIDAAKGKASSG